MRVPSGGSSSSAFPPAAGGSMRLPGGSGSSQSSLPTGSQSTLSRAGPIMRMISSDTGMLGSNGGGRVTSAPADDESMCSSKDVAGSSCSGVSLGRGSAGGHQQAYTQPPRPNITDSPLQAGLCRSFDTALRPDISLRERVSVSARKF